jgi:hypothetical protein
MRGKAIVDAGICGFDATVVTEAQDPMGNARMLLKTECPNLIKLGESIEIDILDVVQRGCDSDSFRELNSVVPAMHCPCPVVSGIIQTVKVAAGLALPKDIHIVILSE